MRYAEKPFPDELPALLAARDMSLRALAREVGVSDSHLSRLTRRADYKTPSVPLMQRIAASLGLPGDYFIEVREAAIVERVRADPRFRETVYRMLNRKPARRN